MWNGWKCSECYLSEQLLNRFQLKASYLMIYPSVRRKTGTRQLKTKPVNGVPFYVPFSLKSLRPMERWYCKAWWHGFRLVKRPDEYFDNSWSEKKVPVILVIGLFDTYQKWIKIGGHNSYQFREKWSWVFYPKNLKKYFFSKK